MRDFNSWLLAKGFNPEELTADQRVTLEAAWRAEQHPTPPAPAPTTAVPPNVAAPAAAAPPTGSSYDERIAAIEAESARIEYIRNATAAVCERYVGSPERIKTFRQMGDAAISDKTCTAQKFEMDLMRADRFNGPLLISASSSAAPPSERLVEIAVARRAGLQSLEKHYDPKELEQSERAFRHGIGLQDLLGLSARANGWRGASVKSSLESRDLWAAAFGGGAAGAPFDIRAGIGGPSTYSIPNIVSNVANKFLFVGFNAVDSVWSRISARRSVNDFKQTTKIGLTGALQYRQVAPSGEIQHDTIGERTYTNQVNTYAIMLGIARTDLINDDLGALSTAGTRVGRGAALKVNDIFWTVFLNNTGSFFVAGNNNVSTGAGSALGTADGAAINAAEVKFMNQTDPDGKPLGIMPAILLAPPTLRNTAARWMGSQLFTPSGTTGLGDTNIFGGRYTVESSPYMENTSYTGNSTAAWYLLANPADAAVIEVVFLNGKDMPTVETADADFNQLGIQMRGYIDFGAALQEFRAGVRSAGS